MKLFKYNNELVSECFCISKWTECKWYGSQGMGDCKFVIWNEDWGNDDGPPRLCRNWKEIEIGKNKDLLICEFDKVIDGLDRL